VVGIPGGVVPQAPEKDPDGAALAPTKFPDGAETASLMSTRAQRMPLRSGPVFFEQVSVWGRQAIQDVQAQAGADDGRAGRSSKSSDAQTHARIKPQRWSLQPRTGHAEIAACWAAKKWEAFCSGGRGS